MVKGPSLAPWSHPCLQFELHSYPSYLRLGSLLLSEQSEPQFLENSSAFDSCNNNNNNNKLYNCFSYDRDVTIHVNYRDMVSNLSKIRRTNLPPNPVDLESFSDMLSQLPDYSTVGDGTPFFWGKVGEEREKVKRLCLRWRNYSLTWQPPRT